MFVNFSTLRERYGQRHVPVSTIPYAANFGQEHKIETLEAYFSENEDFFEEVPNPLPTTTERDYVFDSEFLSDDEFVIPCANNDSHENDVIAYSWLLDELPNCSTIAALRKLDNAPLMKSLNDVYFRLLVETQGSEGQLWHQWYLGPRGSGAPLHYHCQAYNTLAQGEKLWVMIPPEHTGSDVDDGLAWGYSNRQPTTWLQSHIDDLTGHAGASVCVQQAGDTLFVPSYWSHLTVNLRPCLGFATEIYRDC